MPQKRITLNDVDALTLLLNLRGHDSIHDYGSNDERWNKNCKIVQDFSRSYTSPPSALGGGGKTTEFSLTRRKRDEKEQQLKRDREHRKYRRNTFRFHPQKITNTLLNNDYFSRLFRKIKRFLVSTSIDEFNFAIHELINDVKNSILFITFHICLFNFLPILKYTESYNLGLMFSALWFRRTSDEILYNVIQKIIGYYHLNSLPRIETPRDLVMTIWRVLDTTQIVRVSILENLYINSKMVGGARGDELLNKDNATTLIAEIQNHLDSILQNPDPNSSFNLLKRIYHENSETIIPRNDHRITEYTIHRKEILDGFVTIFKKYAQNTKAGNIYGLVEVIPPLKSRITRQAIDLEVNFIEKINCLLYDYHEIIKQHNFEQMKTQYRQQADAQAQLNGSLTSMDKQIRDEFTTCIAKSSLIMTGIYDINGEYIGPNTRDLDVCFLDQYDILCKQAQWASRKTKDLDKELLALTISEFEEFQFTQKHIPDRNLDKYIINNAAPVDEAYKKRTFCPVTSILDGMPLCSTNTAIGCTEKGNIDVILGSQEHNCQAQLTINDDNTVDILIHINSTNFRTIIVDKKNIHLNSSELEAPFILRETLLQLLDVKQQSPDFFDNLLKFMVSNFDFNILFSELLLKVWGDLGQEINSVCRHGGYSNAVTTDTGIKLWDQEGLARRLFVANDRVSAFRFIFLLIKAPQDQINTKAYGGYYSMNEEFIVCRHPGNYVYGGKSKKQKRQTSCKTRRSKIIK